MKQINWRMVLAGSLIGSLVFSLVLAEGDGTLNTSRVESNASIQYSLHQNRASFVPSNDEHKDSSNSNLGSVPPTPIIHSKEQVSLFLDLSQNMLAVVQGDQVLRTALVATGSGKILHDPRNPSRHWTFHTPKGEFIIENKIEQPVWIRPDWAYIEKGMYIPTDPEDRLLPGAMGPYALGFGNGYFIHGGGARYSLGFNVTHGCIQLNEDDLRYVFEKVSVGARLVIV